jgi:hypothetical protein
MGKKARKELLTAISRCARVAGEVGWTNGYRCAYEARGQKFINDTESKRLFDKESSGYVALDVAEKLVVSALRRYRRELLSEVRDAKH